jgi:exodeoxyribonuclease VII large subunit
MNEQIFTVNQLSSQIKSILEVNLCNVHVKGEVVAPKMHTSGHTYFALKDMHASIDCIAWRSVKMDFTLTDGMQVVCIGNVSSYPSRSKYQMIVQKVIPDGIGAIMLKLDELKKRLTAEGLFDQSRKLPLPVFPRAIGIITSSTGAVIHDMLHRLQDRYPCTVCLYNANVQGESAAFEIIAGLKALDGKVDVIVIARGGGSFEDLLCFYDERLVRAIASSTTPIITAVGHETDTTLVDYASSMRAPTPTAAIELITPDKSHLHEQIRYFENILHNAMQSIIKHLHIQIDSVDIRIGDYVAYRLQDLDYIGMDMDAKINAIHMRHARALEKYDVIKPALRQYELTLASIRSMIAQNLRHAYRIKSVELDSITNLYEALSYKETLRRGYCIAKSESGIITRGAEVDDLRAIDLMFYDKTVHINKKNNT